MKAQLESTTMQMQSITDAIKNIPPVWRNLWIVLRPTKLFVCCSLLLMWKVMVVVGVNDWTISFLCCSWSQTVSWTCFFSFSNFPNWYYKEVETINENAQNRKKNYKQSSFSSFQFPNYITNWCEMNIIKDIIKNIKLNLKLKKKTKKK